MQLSITTNASDIVARLQALPTMLQGTLFDAMGRSLDSAENYAVDYMYSHFKNPTGELEGAFYQVIEDVGDGVTGQLTNPSKYAWRRHEGYEGMFDSLGRGPFHDKGIYYLKETLIAQTPIIEGIFTDSIGRVIGGI